MSNPWDERFDAYRNSQTHADGADLDSFIEWCEPEPDLTVLDVATGGGHVARRLRDCGCIVTTCDEAAGMRPDVVCPAEDLPFEDESFDIVTCRLAPHHFTSVQAAVSEMARVSRGPVVIEDTLYASEEVEQAERLRDPTHVRCYSENEWLGFCEWAALDVPLVGFFLKQHPMDQWLAATGCAGKTAARVRELLAPLSEPDGSAWTDKKLLIRADKTR